MKALWIDHPEADFQAALLYMGLCEELGAENVVDVPYKRSYHGETHNYPSEYTRGEGSSPWHSWNDGVGTTSPFAWMRASLGREWSQAEVVSKIDEFDVVVLASPRTVGINLVDDLVRTVGRQQLRNLCIVDGEDYAEIRWDLCERFQPKVYFKREMIPNPPVSPSWARPSMRDCVRILPFPFASAVPEIAAKPKDIDVMFLAGASWPGRDVVLGALRASLGDRLFSGHVSYDQYLDTINRSKIAISVRGHGMDTLRFWEIPSFETMLIADRLSLIKPFPFEDGVHAVYFDDPAGAVQAVRCALEDDAWRVRVARAGNVHLRQHHTARARARQLLEAASS